jgi:hypothetical protein
MSSGTFTRQKNASETIRRQRRASTSDLARRFFQGPRDSDAREREEKALREQREWLSERTKCHEIGSWAFLATFLPVLDRDRLDLVNKHLLERNVLTPSGWQDLIQCELPHVTEHAMFHKPLGEIANAIIGILAEVPEAGQALGELVPQIV